MREIEALVILIAVRLHPAGEAAGTVGRALAGLGLRTALDLQPMQAGEPEVVELMHSLSLAEVSLGDRRAKIRLLVGDRAHHLGRLTATADAAQDLAGGRPAIPQPQGQVSARDDDEHVATSKAVDDDEDSRASKDGTSHTRVQSVRSGGGCKKTAGCPWTQSPSSSPCSWVRRAILSKH